MIELNIENFATEVIERSHTVPVLVDFWADWCAPCKMLAPVLDKLAADYQGQLLIGKVNTDQQRELAERNAIRSLPTLRLYRNGEAVEEILGAQPESTLRGLIEAHIPRASDGSLQEGLALAAAGDQAGAIDLLEQALQEDPANAHIPPALIRLHIEQGNLERAGALWENLPREDRESTEGKGLNALIEFAAHAADAAEIDTLKATLNETPGDSRARYTLAARQVLDGDYDTALENFLELLKRDRRYEDGAAQRGLLTVFSLLDENDERIARYRRQMASLLL